MKSPALRGIKRPGKFGRPIGRMALYNLSSQYAIEMLEILVDQARHCEIPSVKMGAARTVLSKCLPDLKSVEGFIKDQKEIKITIGGAKPLAGEILKASEVAEIVKKRKEEIEGKKEEKAE